MIVVIALGGNAIKKRRASGTYHEQNITVRDVCMQLERPIRNGHVLVITHGNGPQVGDILLQQEASKNLVPPMPLDVCGAFSQGFIGYMIQQNLKNMIDGNVVTLITQVLIDKNDPAFQNPTKPIGPFYDKAEAEQMQRHGLPVIEDSGRGYRRVVASPHPKKIIEGEIIRQLLDKGTIVIAAGGGGVPVFEDGGLEGIEAVIDKDLTACELAIEVGADVLLIATDVDSVFLNYRKENEMALGEISVKEIEGYLKEGHFGMGSMEPKIRAGIKFVLSTGRKAIITSDRKITEALEGKAGTTILP